MIRARRIWPSDLPRKNCSDDFSPKSLILLIATIDSAQVGLSGGSVRARMLVDATGRARWLGRALDIASPPRSPRLLARYGYVEGECPARDGAPALVADANG